MRLIARTFHFRHTYCDRCYRSVVSPSVCMSVCMQACISSVTLVRPAKAVRWNELPFGRDTHANSSNVVLDGKGRFGESETPSSQRYRLSPNYFGLCCRTSLANFYQNSLVCCSKIQTDFIVLPTRHLSSKNHKSC